MLSASKTHGLTPARQAEDENAAPQFVSPPSVQQMQHVPAFISPGSSSAASSTPGFQSPASQSFISPGMDMMGGAGTMFGRGTM